ncbi:PREDICTED: dynein assembly factor 1, axonemal homolog, partial [Nicrophorus vespilloides]|uniref:Dynein axonemal assembly factor 1 homolog n=1 Tax=Nicrophorus vespilloides TaxID=110193 RepID=A0ABM1MU09_NICVS
DNKVLHTLNLSNNYVETLDEFEELANLDELSVLDLANNHIDDPLIVTVCGEMKNLRVLNLMGNPVIRKIPSYRKTMILACKNLHYLDDRPVFPRDRACAEAWERGGSAEECAERKRWIDRERQRIMNSVNALIEMRDRRRAQQQPDSGFGTSVHDSESEAENVSMEGVRVQDSESEADAVSVEGVRVQDSESEADAVSIEGGRVRGIYYEGIEDEQQQQLLEPIANNRNEDRSSSSAESVSDSESSDDEDNFMNDRQTTEDYSNYRENIFDFSPRSSSNAPRKLIEEVIVDATVEEIANEEARKVREIKYDQMSSFGKSYKTAENIEEVKPKLIETTIGGVAPGKLGGGSEWTVLKNQEECEMINSEVACPNELQLENLIIPTESTIVISEKDKEMDLENQEESIKSTTILIETEDTSIKIDEKYNKITSMVDHEIVTKDSEDILITVDKIITLNTEDFNICKLLKSSELGNIAPEDNSKYNKIFKDEDIMCEIVTSDELKDDKNEKSSVNAEAVNEEIELDILDSTESIEEVNNNFQEIFQEDEETIRDAFKDYELNLYTAEEFEEDIKKVEEFDGKKQNIAADGNEVESEFDASYMCDSHGNNNLEMKESQDLALKEQTVGRNENDEKSDDEECITNRMECERRLLELLKEQEDECAFYRKLDRDSQMEAPDVVVNDNYDDDAIIDLVERPKREEIRKPNEEQIRGRWREFSEDLRELLQWDLKSLKKRENIIVPLPLKNKYAKIEDEDDEEDEQYEIEQKYSKVSFSTINYDKIKHEATNNNAEVIISKISGIRSDLKGFVEELDKFTGKFHKQYESLVDKYNKNWQENGKLAEIRKVLNANGGMLLDEDRRYLQQLIDSNKKRIREEEDEDVDEKYEEVFGKPVTKAEVSEGSGNDVTPQIDVCSNNEDETEDGLVKTNKIICSLEMQMAQNE